MVLRSVGIVDAVVDRSVYRLARDLLRHAGRDDPLGLLPHRGRIPTRILPIVAAHVEDVIDRNAPDPSWSAVRQPSLTER